MLLDNAFVSYLKKFLRKETNHNRLAHKPRITKGSVSYRTEQTNSIYVVFIPIFTYEQTKLRVYMCHMRERTFPQPCHRRCCSPDSVTITRFRSHSVRITCLLNSGCNRESTHFTYTSTKRFRAPSQKRVSGTNCL
jgi:hypothetical protein